MSAADPIAAIRTILLDDTTVAGLVSTRVYGGEIPDAQVKNMEETCIVIKGAGGPANPGGGYQQYGKHRLDIVCYGASLNESWGVYLAAYAALKAIRRIVSEHVLVHSADVSAKGTTARDPIKLWPTTYSSWLVLIAEITES